MVRQRYIYVVIFFYLHTSASFYDTLPFQTKNIQHRRAFALGREKVVRFTCKVPAFSEAVEMILSTCFWVTGLCRVAIFVKS